MRRAQAQRRGLPKPPCQRPLLRSSRPSYPDVGSLRPHRNHLIGFADYTDSADGASIANAAAIRASALNESNGLRALSTSRARLNRLSAAPASSGDSAATALISDSDPLQ